MPKRYDGVTIALHWSIAALIIAAFALEQGVKDSAPLDPAYVLHALAGLAVLVLSLVRIVWRLVTPAPPYPAAMPRWQRRAARAMAFAFYALMILMPLTGWISHSLEYGGAFGSNTGLEVFGYLTVPAFPGWQHFPPNTMKHLHNALTHWWIPLLALHVIAALWHHFRDHDDVLKRMLPLKRSVSEA